MGDVHRVVLDRLYSLYNIHMSQTVISVIVQLLALGLPALGVTVGSSQLTGAIQTIVLVASGLWIWYRRYKVGDIKVSGVRK